MLRQLVTQGVGIVAVGVIAWLLARWRGRPERLGLRIMQVTLVLAVAAIALRRQLSTDLVGWAYLLGAIAFGVAYSINVTLEQTPKVMAGRSGRELFNRRHSLGALATTGPFLVVGLVGGGWWLVVAGGGSMLGIGLILLRESRHRPKPTPPPPTGLEIRSPARK